jgi:hypothetical protein
MITFKTGLAKNEVSTVKTLVDEIVDTYSDFYITKNNLRLMIKDNFDVLLDCLKKGDKIAFDDSGMTVITGYSDKSPRKYLKILVKDIKHVAPLLKILFWNVKEREVYIKLKNNNPLKNYLLSKPSVYTFEGHNYFADGTLTDKKNNGHKSPNFAKEKARLLFSGFEFVGGRGKESLLRYVAVEQREPAHKNFSKDKDE